jgi:isocitrate lyase
MTAYSKLQEQEFRAEAEDGYRAVKHQQFVGTGYFDDVTQVIAAGASSTTALAGSTEEEQFHGEMCGRVPCENRIPPVHIGKSDVA